MSSEIHLEREAERRTTVRRANQERRAGERRSPDRATVGRRVQFVPDRRSELRRAMDRSVQPA